MFSNKSRHKINAQAKDNRNAYTKVFLASIILEVRIWMPARIMKLAAKTRLAPITGVGIITKTEASLGKKALNINIPPIE